MIPVISRGKMLRDFGRSFVLDEPNLCSKKIRDVDGTIAGACGYEGGVLGGIERHMPAPVRR
jgi:hypothetical protein